MKNRLFGVFFVCLFTLSVCLSSSFALEFQPSTEENDLQRKQTIISLNKASNDRIVELFSKSDVKELRTVSTVGGEIYTTGYVLAETTKLDEAINSFEKRYYDLLLETMEAYESNNPEMYSVFASRLENYLAEGMSISAVVIGGELDEKTASKMQNNIFVDKIETLSLPISKNSGESAVLTASSDSGNWVPTSGNAVVWNSTRLENAVYMNLNWSWDSDDDLSYYQSTNNVTLESEICFYNYDGNAHSIEWYSGDWTYDTNQENPYQDTQFNFNNLDEVPFTIGSHDAREFESGQNYYWVCYGNINNSAGSMAKIFFQRGKKFLQIPNEWAIVSQATQKVVSYTEWNTGNNSTVSFTWSGS